MSTVADQLRQAREAQKLTVYQAADATKIRTDHIRALDAGNFDVFAAPVYVRGFVRSYAGFLKLDVPQIMASLEAELAQSEKHHQHPPLLPSRRGALDFVMFQLSKLNWRIVLPLLAGSLILIVGVSIYRVWQIQRNKNPLSGLGPGLYQSKKDSGEVLPLSPPKK